MSKKLLFANQVRAGGQLHPELLEGVTQLALAVGSTLGPRGRNVIIDRAGDTPLVTKDGVTVARNVQLTNPVHHAAVKMVQAVARATVEEAGDGTTTATVLAHNLLKDGLEIVSGTAYQLRGPKWIDRLPWLSYLPSMCRPIQCSPVLLQRSIAAAVDAVSAYIQKVAVPPTDEQIAQVATISTNGNAAIGELLLEAVQKVGRDGLITLEDSPTSETWLELRQGFQFESGFTSPDFITERNRGVAILENPYIFITERALTQGIGQGAPTLHSLGPLLTFCAGLSSDGKSQIREARPLLIVADDIQGDAATDLSVNCLNKIIKVCAVRAPAFGEMRRAMLADLAMVTGGQVLKADGGQLVSKWVMDDKRMSTGERLGSCTRAVISNGRTIIEGGVGSVDEPDLIPRFAASLIEQANASAGFANPLAREQLLQRAARLTGSVAVIRVGAATEAEARALRDAVEDAVLAVRAALVEGIVPGGGLCLFAAAQMLENAASDMPSVLALGAQLVADAMRAPLRMIASNGGQNPDTIVAQIVAAARSNHGNLTVGYNAATGKFEDLVAAGVVDPAKVVRVALQKAASIAALMLTSSCLVYFDPEALKAPSSPVGR